MKERIEFAILGYGNIGKRYAEVLDQMPDVKLRALIDTTFPQTQVNTFPLIFKNLSDFFTADVSCDIVIVATPNGLHFEHAKACLQAGFHVLVEKPVAFKVAEVRKLIEISNAQARLLFPVWQIRYSPLIAEIKRLLSAGVLGKVFWVQADCFWNRGEEYYNNHAWHGTLRLDGGPLYTQFSHVIDLFSWLCTDITVQDSTFYKIRSKLRTEFEDSGVVNFKLKDDGVALLSYTTSAPPGASSNELTIITEKAKIQLSGKYFETLMFLQTDENEIRTGLDAVTGKPIKDITRYCTEKLIQQAVLAIANPSRESDLLAASHIIEQIYSLRPALAGKDLM